MIEVKYGKRKVINYRGARMVVGGLTAKNKIAILLRIAREFSNSESEEELFEQVLALSEDIFEPNNITLRILRGGMLEPVAYLKETDPPRRALEPGEGYSGMVFLQKKPSFFPDLSHHPEHLDEGEKTRCVVCVPIISREEMLGTLAIESDEPNFYKKDDLEILEAMALQLGLALMETRLVAGLQDTRNRLESDLKMGRTVQGQIVDGAVSPWNGLHVETFYEPMVEVSGDYYDVVPWGDSLNILIVDVAGHGVPAALVTMIIHFQFRALVRSGLGIREILVSLNEELLPKLPDDSYLTAQVFRVWEDLSYSFVNAGHQKLAIYNAGEDKVTELDTPGIPLGIMPQKVSQFEELTGQLEPGDSVLMVTDGFAEEKNNFGEEFGVDAVLDLFQDGARDFGRNGRDFKPLEKFIEDWKIKLGRSNGFDDDLTALWLTVNPNLRRARQISREGREQYQVGNLKEARLRCEQAMALESSLGENLLLHGRIFYRAKDYPRAVKAFQAFIDTIGDNLPHYRYYLARALFKASQLESAKMEAKKVLAADPKYYRASLLLVQCYLTEKRYKKAGLVLEKALRLAPGNPQLLRAAELVSSRYEELKGFFQSKSDITDD